MFFLSFVRTETKRRAIRKRWREERNRKEIPRCCTKNWLLESHSNRSFVGCCCCFRATRSPMSFSITALEMGSNWFISKDNLASQVRLQIANHRAADTRPPRCVLRILPEIASDSEPFCQTSHVTRIHSKSNAIQKRQQWKLGQQRSK